MIENYECTTKKQLSKIFITLKWLLVAISCYILLIAVPEVVNKEQQTQEVRLRVVANSNSHDDQQQKQLIADDTVQLITANKKINSYSIEKILTSKYPQRTIRVAYDTHLFPVKYQQGIFTPQNYYPSLVVMIGQARGDNWWCTLFDDVCERTVDSKRKQEKKRVKFWILERWEDD